MSEDVKNLSEQASLLKELDNLENTKKPEHQLFLAQYRHQLENPSLRIEDTESGEKIAYNHLDQIDGKLLTMAAMGIQSSSFYERILLQMGTLGAQGAGLDEATLNFAVDAIKGIAPKDTVEVMQAAQMTAIHIHTMRYARRMLLAVSDVDAEAAERGFNRLTRSFAAHIEALKRYRAGLTQSLSVGQVNVCEGGQAIVGTVSNQPKIK
jgi:hypothetical protein